MIRFSHLAKYRRWQVIALSRLNHCFSKLFCWCHRGVDHLPQFSHAKSRFAAVCRLTLHSSCFSRRYRFLWWFVHRLRNKSTMPPVQPPRSESSLTFTAAFNFSAFVLKRHLLLKAWLMNSLLRRLRLSFAKCLTGKNYSNLQTIMTCRIRDTPTGAFHTRAESSFRDLGRRRKTVIGGTGNLSSENLPRWAICIGTDAVPQTEGSSTAVIMA